MKEKDEQQTATGKRVGSTISTECPDNPRTQEIFKQLRQSGMKKKEPYRNICEWNNQTTSDITRCEVRRNSPA
jgi:hypothetical protein